MLLRRLEIAHPRLTARRITVDSTSSTGPRRPLVLPARRSAEPVRLPYGSSRQQVVPSSSLLVRNAGSASRSKSRRLRNAVTTR